VKIFVAGASGVIGRSLVPQLVEAGHDVAGMTRKPQNVQVIERMGARGHVGDVFDRVRLDELMTKERPEVVVDELTDLPRALGPSSQSQFDGNVRIRVEGTRNLVDAARAAGARRVVAQSYAHVYAPVGSWVKSEDDPLNIGADTPEIRRRNAEAVRKLEHTVLESPDIEGVALRYGALYGPGTAYAPNGSIAHLMRIRHYPIVGDGAGLTSFIHVDDAAAATVLALTGAGGVYNIVDDEPARVAEWAPLLARLLGAPAPRHVPSFVIRVLGREHLIYRATEQRGASNAKAKALLEFGPHHPTWREGFKDMVTEQAVAA
jgi:nucleoside-diphosphate-sugar epimerase